MHAKAGHVSYDRAVDPDGQRGGSRSLTHEASGLAGEQRYGRPDLIDTPARFRYGPLIINKMSQEETALRRRYRYLSLRQASTLGMVHLYLKDV